MNPIKKKLGMTTDEGTNRQGVLWLALSGVLALPDGAAKNVLMGLWMVMMASISWLTVGAKADPEYVDMQKELKDVLQEGRE